MLRHVFIVAMLVHGEAAKPPTKPTFGDMFLGGAVLQRQTHVAVWGTSSSKEIELSLDGAAPLKVPVNSSWMWYTHLPPQKAGWNRTLQVKDSNGEATVSVMFGETILCVGQSNMAMHVGPSWRDFDADNATAESKASADYTGKISLHSRLSQYLPARGVNMYSTTWYAVNPESIKMFSAVCWLTGRNLFDSLGGNVPVGLAENSMGAHSIETWLNFESTKACGVTTPCTEKQPIGKIWSKTVTPMQPFTFGSMIFDQGEQNTHCMPDDREAVYPCLQAELVKSYRAQFNSSFPFIAVQLPGYKKGIFNMRLQQEKGAALVENAAVVPTYDDSCAMGKTDGCPHGSVHNEHKQIVGERLALLLQKMKLGAEIVAEGPRVSSITAKGANNMFQVRVQFDMEDLVLKGTRNCTSCCGGDTSDFDFSLDGQTWYNSSAPAVVQSNFVAMSVRMPNAPKMARYTGNQVFPQCAVYNQRGLPAFPFLEKVSVESDETFLV